jgi:hypothetical protein
LIPEIDVRLMDTSYMAKYTDGYEINGLKNSTIKSLTLSDLVLCFRLVDSKNCLIVAFLFLSSFNFSFIATNKNSQEGLLYQPTPQIGCCVHL